jgi:putative NADPH-quinone reductase
VSLTADINPKHPAIKKARNAFCNSILSRPDALDMVQMCADHLVTVYPLWQGQFPALFHAFLEPSFRSGFAAEIRDGGVPKKLLTGMSARIAVTMGMSALVYRWYFGAHSLKSLEHNLLRFPGIAPVKATLIGGLGREPRCSPLRRTFP